MATYDARATKLTKIKNRVFIGNRVSNFEEDIRVFRIIGEGAYTYFETGQTLTAGHYWELSGGYSSDYPAHGPFKTRAAAIAHARKYMLGVADAHYAG